ncbi:hypothetical protein AX16_004073 [Volvariella volvacea WC 439]|nr:hypothetical protein AX16_004073 [Volvariella volvacea WC 439]
MRFSPSDPTCTSRSRSMHSPLFKARLAQASATVRGELASGSHQIALAQLRQHKNSLTSIYALPAELIAEILSILAEEDFTTVEDSIDQMPYYARTVRAYTWITATQFCALWRRVALDNRRLWTRVWMTDLGLFKAFVERSVGQPLYVNTWRGHASNMEYDEMFMHLVANMHRVRSLHLWQCAAGHRLSWLYNRRARQLEVLKLRNLWNPPIPSPSPTPSPPSSSYRGDSDSDDDEASVEAKAFYSALMPELRRLEVKSCVQDDWAALLPSHLPTVTHLSIGCFSYSDQLDLIKRCQGVRHLVVEMTEDSWSSDDDEPWQAPSVTLPSLIYLSVDPPSWEMLKQGAIQPIRTVNFVCNGGSMDAAQAFNALMDLLDWETLKDSTQLALARPDRLFMTWSADNMFSLRACDASGKDVITLNSPALEESFFLPYIHLIGSSDTSCVTTQEIDVGFIPASSIAQKCLRDFFFELSRATITTVIRLRNIYAFTLFVDSWRWYDPICRKCPRSHCVGCGAEGPPLGYISLETLVLDLGERHFMDANSWVLMWFVYSLRERRIRGPGLKRLKLSYSKSVGGLARSLENQVSPFVGEVIAEET